MVKSMLTAVLGIVLVMSGLFAIADAEPREKKRPKPDYQFRELDKNGDRRLSQAEFLGEARKNGRDKAKSLFATIDRDRDNHISGEEFKEMKRLMTRPGQTGWGVHE